MICSITSFLQEWYLLWSDISVYISFHFCNIAMKILGWPKSLSVFFHKMALVHLAVFKVIETILLDCMVTAVMSVYILKSLSKLAHFCLAILVLKMEENMQYFWHIMLYYFKKGKTQLKHTPKKDLCSVWRRHCD